MEIKNKIKKFIKLIGLITKWFFIGLGIFVAHAFTYGVSTVVIIGYWAYHRGRTRKMTRVLREVGLDDAEIQYIFAKLKNKADKKFDFELEKNEGEVVRVEE